MMDYQGVLQSFQANSSIVHQLGHNHFSTNPFEFLYHQSYH